MSSGPAGSIVTGTSKVPGVARANAKVRPLSIVVALAIPPAARIVQQLGGEGFGSSERPVDEKAGAAARQSCRGARAPHDRQVDLGAVGLQRA